MCKHNPLKKVVKGIGGLFGFTKPKTYTAKTQQVAVESPAAMNVTNSNVSDSAETSNARRKRKGFSSTMLADLAASINGDDSDGNSTLG